MKLFQGIDKGGCDVGSRLTVQPLCLNEPGTSGRIPKGASKVASGLGVVVGTLSTGSVTPRHGQSSESDVVHDHIRLRQHKIATIACIVVRIGARHVKHLGTTEGCETVGGSSSSRELGPGGRSTKMINDSCSYANREVLVKRVSKNLLPTTHAW